MEADAFIRYVRHARRSASQDLADVSALRIKIDADSEGRYHATCAQADWLVVTGGSFREAWYGAMAGIMLVYDWVQDEP